MSEIERMLREQPHIIKAALDAVEEDKRRHLTLGGIDPAEWSNIKAAAEEFERSKGLAPSLVQQATEDAIKELRDRPDSGSPIPSADHAIAMQQAADQRKAEIQAFIRQEVKAEVARQLQQLQPRKGGSAPLE